MFEKDGLGLGLSVKNIFTGLEVIAAKICKLQARSPSL